MYHNCVDVYVPCALCVWQTQQAPKYRCTGGSYIFAAGPLHNVDIVCDSCLMQFSCRSSSQMLNILKMILVLFNV